MVMKILLLDDDGFMLRLLAQQLAQLGFHDVTQCKWAHEALALVEAAPQGFGLVVCDLQMPKMDGIEFFRHLAALGFSGGVLVVSGEDPRIAQTALGLARAHRLDAIGALSKPVSREALQGLLENRKPRAAVRAAAAAYPPQELQQAMATGELVLHYQPKRELAHGVVAGVEALVRWQHPRDGLVFPDRFITTAEQNGLIHELTRYVLRQAVIQSRAWQDRGLSLPVAVNVSMDNLAVLEFADFVGQQVQLAGSPASHLRLEVTESRLMQDLIGPLDVLTRLRLKRISLSIDDFGTGHSSLVQLRDIPFEELKVDRSFIHGACADTSKRAIVEGSIRMAQQLGMTTVAEGVEDLADWRFVRDVGCTWAQGYFIAKPLPGSGLPAWIDSWRIRWQHLSR
jgi:EAL domain-containing protein (putative c-di-GMP-specific phosphodiesterase class I)/ActR/RegA family two-component response regulator